MIKTHFISMYKDFLKYHAKLSINLSGQKRISFYYFGLPENEPVIYCLEDYYSDSYLIKYGLFKWLMTVSKKYI